MLNGRLKKDIKILTRRRDWLNARSLDIPGKSYDQQEAAALDRIIRTLEKLGIDETFDYRNYSKSIYETFED